MEREAYVQKDVRFTTDVENGQVDVNSTFNTETYLRRPETTYGGKIDSIAGKKGIKNDSIKNNELKKINIIKNFLPVRIYTD